VAVGLRAQAAATTDERVLKEHHRELIDIVVDADADVDLALVAGNVVDAATEFAVPRSRSMESRGTQLWF
jgi:hypothetical protein